MRHRIKKIRLKGGIDSSKMLRRQLLKSFIKSGKITTTKRRVVVLRSDVEILVNKAKRGTMADKNYLLRKLSDKNSIMILMKTVSPVFKKRVGGYVRIVNEHPRESDGATMASMSWTDPVVLVEKKVVVEPPKKLPVAKKK